jgi:hypothetical protein
MNEAQISKQHPIPQNFMDVEFKIVGDFTVRQFTYLCITGFPMYLIYNSPIQSFLKTILLIVLGLLGFMLVFVPIDDRSMDVWIVNFFKSVYSNNRRTWRKTPVIPKTLSMEAIRIVQGEMITLAPTSSRRKLEEYLKGIKEEAPDEFDFDFKKHRFAEIKMQESPTQVAPASSPTTVVSSETKKPALEEVIIKIPSLVKPDQTPPEKPKDFIKKISQPVQQIPTSIKEIIKPKPKTEKPIDIHEEYRTSTTEVPGRKFVSFGQVEQEIILPIRGEKTINILGSKVPTYSLESKDIKTLTKELRTLVREIKHDEKQAILPETPVTSNERIIESSLSGLCFDSNNNPLPNLILSLIDGNDNELQYTRTDTFGKFTFRNTPTGNLKIKILNPEIYSLNFDIINLSVTKYPYTIIQILGKKNG